MVEVAVVPIESGPLVPMSEEKKLVVVAAVPVAEVKVRPWRVETPATARVPVKLAAEEMVCPLMSPVVKAAKVEAPATFKVPPIEVLPVVRVVEKRLVELAVPAKLVVEVALVVVLLSPVKFWRVVEALARSCWKEEIAVV